MRGVLCLVGFRLDAVAELLDEHLQSPLRRADGGAVLAELVIDGLESGDCAAMLVLELICHFGVEVEVLENETGDVIFSDGEHGELILLRDFEEPILVRHLDIEAEDGLSEGFESLPVVETAETVVEALMVTDKQPEGLELFFVFGAERLEVFGLFQIS